MQVSEARIIRLIERIGDHFRANISNRFIRPALLQLPIEKQTWDLIEALTDKMDQYHYQGSELDDLYRQLNASAQFVALCRRDLASSIRGRVSSFMPSGSEKVLWDMAVNNFASNLQVFADLLNELYVSLVELDKAASKGRKPLYLRIPGLEKIGRLLVDK